MSRHLGFSKVKRLKKSKDIETLFQTGKAFRVYPLKCVLSTHQQTAEQTERIKVAVGIAKKNCKRAHNRNYVKRLLRECVRLQWHSLEQLAGGQQLHMFVSFVGDWQLVNLEMVEQAYQQLLLQIHNHLKT